MAKLWMFEPEKTSFVEKQVFKMGGEVNQAAWNPNGIQLATIASTLSGDQVQVWDVQTSESLWQGKGHSADLSYVSWNDDGGKLVTSSYNGEVFVWNLTHPDPEAKLLAHIGIVNQASWQPNGSLILTAGDDGKALVWNPSWQEPILTAYHSKSVNQASWSPSGSYFVTASNDLTSQIWDVNSSTQIALLQGHSDFINQAVWSPDGTQIVTASDDGTARVYYFSIDDLIRIACERVVRNMSIEEWASYMGGEEYRETCSTNPMP